MRMRAWWWWWWWSGWRRSGRRRRRRWHGHEQYDEHESRHDAIHDANDDDVRHDGRRRRRRRWRKFWSWKRRRCPNGRARHGEGRQRRRLQVRFELWLWMVQRWQVGRRRRRLRRGRLWHRMGIEWMGKMMIQMLTLSFPSFSSSSLSSHVFLNFLIHFFFARILVYNVKNVHSLCTVFFWRLLLF